MTLEEMMSMSDIRSIPASQMPASTAPPSIEELFRQGNVQVSPGATGPESARTMGNVPPSAQAAGYGGLADLYRMGADAPEGTTAPQLEQLMGIAAPQQARLDTERL